MNFDIDVWIEALKSGKYKQVTNSLSRQVDSAVEAPVYGFCCLGVACDLFLDSDWENRIGGKRSIEGMEAYPPVVLQWAIEGALVPGVGLRQLSEMNDNGATFEEIADYIEKKRQT